ncbi:MAG TPA: type IV toxin-antitoxin system AbiEi family antitoxin domain-containing protein, partial [Kofleriaceae bacterium]|nr:type IV toxin-antitoxin system AbiEi family antitoxin domain-containing protein [Kofleriaceae bacterium]
NWDRLYETAGAQDGYFTTQQAANAGYSPQLLLKHIRAGRIARERRGIYRLVHFPAGEHEELAVVWLWSQHAGVFSHQTALSLHALSDVLPSQIHLTLPPEWRHRRFRLPPGVVVHHAAVPHDDRVWFASVPATSARRTLEDCAMAGVSPELLRESAQQALRRGLVVSDDLAEVARALAPFGGLAE